jgi:integrase
MTPRRHRALPPGLTRITLPSGEHRYRLQLGSRGKGNRRSKLFPQTSAGLQAALALHEEWTTRGLPPTGAPPLSSRHDAVATVDDGLRHRVLDLEQRGKSGAVPERIRVFLRQHWTEGAALSLSSVTVAHIEEYRNRRLATCQPNTVIRELRDLRAMLKQAVPDLKVPVSIFPPENLTRVRMLTPDEYHRVFPYLAERFGVTFADLSELALLGVMRQADVRLLQRSHVRWAERLLLLPRTKGGPRAVRLRDEAVAILTRALARQPQHAYVFANPRTGEPYSRVHVSRCWHKAAKACGLQDFTFHDLRHHGPTDAVNRGASVPILQQMGGWKSPAMVSRYASVMNPALDHYLDQLRPPQPGDSPR